MNYFSRQVVLEPAIQSIKYGHLVNNCNTVALAGSARLQLHCHCAHTSNKPWATLYLSQNQSTVSKQTETTAGMKGLPDGV